MVLKRGWNTRIAADLLTICLLVGSWLRQVFILLYDPETDIDQKCSTLFQIDPMRKTV